MKEIIKTVAECLLMLSLIAGLAVCTVLFNYGLIDYYHNKRMQISTGADLYVDNAAYSGEITAKRN